MLLFCLVCPNMLRHSSQKGAMLVRFPFPLGLVVLKRQKLTASCNCSVILCRPDASYLPLQACRSATPGVPRGTLLAGARSKTVDGLITRLGSSVCPQARALQLFTIFTLLLVSPRCLLAPAQGRGRPP